MKTEQLVFIGIKGSVVALNRATGEQVWATRLKGAEFVNVAFESGAVLATTCGEVFCLDALTGITMWHNSLRGFGLGLGTIATARNSGETNAVALAEQRRRAEAAAAAQAAVTSA
jgi:outer membrane protein assembly factor BamB